MLLALDKRSTCCALDSGARALRALSTAALALTAACTEGRLVWRKGFNTVYTCGCHNALHLHSRGLNRSRMTSHRHQQRCLPSGRREQ